MGHVLGTQDTHKFHTAKIINMAYPYEMTTGEAHHEYGINLIQVMGDPTPVFADNCQEIRVHHNGDIWYLPNGKNDVVPINYGWVRIPVAAIARISFNSKKKT